MPVNRGFTGKIVQTVTGAAAGVAGTEYVVGTTGVGTGSGVLFIGVNTDTARAAKVAADGTLFITGTISGGGGGIQYVQDTTSQADTASGTIFLGINSTTVRGIRVTADGTVFVTNTGTQVISGLISTVSTVLGTLAISGTVDGTFGAGKQYIQDSTTIGVTGTGTLFIGVNATTARALTLSATGDPGVRQITSPWVVTAANVTIASVTTGTVTIANPSIMYTHADTGMATTAQGFISMGMVTAATTGRAVAVSVTGGQYVLFPTTQAVTAANVTIASITTGTVNVVNVLSATGVTIASVTTGTMNVVNVLSATGVLLGATTAIAGAFVQTAHSSNWSACVISTTSGGGHAILKTSGAHTLYVTDLFVSVNVTMMVSIYSSSAAQAPKLVAYLATKGGFAFNLLSPIQLTSAQSLVFIGDASGSCAAVAAGYTVT